MRKARGRPISQDVTENSSLHVSRNDRFVGVAALSVSRCCFDAIAAVVSLGQSPSSTKRLEMINQRDQQQAER